MTISRQIIVIKKPYFTIWRSPPTKTAQAEVKRKVNERTTSGVCGMMVDFTNSLKSIRFSEVKMKKNSTYSPQKNPPKYFPYTVCSIPNRFFVGKLSTSLAYIQAKGQQMIRANRTIIQESWRVMETKKEDSREED